MQYHCKTYETQRNKKNLIPRQPLRLQVTGEDANLNAEAFLS